MNKHLKARFVSVVLMMVSIVGCGSRVEVAKEKALAKIDSLLGTMVVKRKEIDISVRALKDGINGLRKAKIKAQVKHDQLEQTVAPITDKIASVDQSLKKLRAYLASGEPVDVAGKTYSPQELKHGTRGGRRWRRSRGLAFAPRYMPTCTERARRRGLRLNRHPRRSTTKVRAADRGRSLA